MKTDRLTIRLISIVFCPLFILFLLSGCGAKKKMVVENSTPEVLLEEEVVDEPLWITCLIQSARATVVRNGEGMTVNVTMQTIRDSMIIVSVMPLFGLEILRLEATPTELIGIDKLHGQYAKTTFAALNQKLNPTLNWDILQQICTAELPTGNESAQLQYTFGRETIELLILYPERQLDVPLSARHQPLSRYKHVDISKWL